MTAEKLGAVPPRTHEHVAVLMGGLSVEREVSLNSGKAVGAALEAEGYRVTLVDAGRDVATRLSEVKPDACFNALHGRFGEDDCVQGILETLAIPYTHSGVLASACGHAQGACQGRDAAGGRAGRRGEGRPPARRHGQPCSSATLCREAAR